VKCYICSIAFHGAEKGKLRKVHQKYLQGIIERRWSKMEASWTDDVLNEDVLYRVKVERNIYIQYENEGRLDCSHFE
jgi:hypothetical protein